MNSVFPSDHSVGKSHEIGDQERYNRRIDAINYTLAHDDGQTNKGLEDADVVLVGVSRSGKTPTSLYLAMQYGIKAANYPAYSRRFRARRTSARTGKLQRQDIRSFHFSQASL